jgi:hypothetical protein
MTGILNRVEKLGAGALVLLISCFILAQSGASIALAADEEPIQFGPLTSPQDTALVRTFLEETEQTLPTADMVAARFEDLPIRVVRVESPKYCEKADCTTVVLVEGLSPLRIMANSHVMRGRGPGTAHLRFLRRCAEVTIEIRSMAFHLTSKPQTPCSIQ